MNELIATETTEEIIPAADAPTDDISTVTGDVTPGQADDSPADAAPAQYDKSNLDKRMSELTKQRREAIEENAYLKGKLEAMEQIKPIVPEVPKPKELDRYDFDSDEAYIDAKVQSAVGSVKEELAADKKRRDDSRRATNVNAQYDKGREKYPDFDEVAIDRNVVKSMDVFEAIESTGDDMPDVMHYLGSNAKQAAKLHGLTPVKLGIAVGKIVEKVKNKPAPPAKKQSSAPDPPPSVKTGGKSTTVDIHTMTQAEQRAKWEADRRAGLGVK